MTVQSELEALRNGDGRIHPPEVLEWARANPESDVAKRLTWDDAKAAEQHRLDQIRRLIWVFVRSDEGERTVISLTSDRHSGGGYRDVGRVFSSSELRSIALRDAVRELRRVEKKYKHFQELAAVFAATNEVAAAIEAPAAA